LIGRFGPWSDVWLKSTEQTRSDDMNRRTSWEQVKANEPLTEAGRSADEDEDRITAFRALVFRLRTEAGLTQAELANRMGITQSAIARMEGGGTRPNLDTLERLAAAVGGELVVGVGERLSENPTIARLVREGHAVVSSRS
jgi:ribosome-binding protein aMBF1 (putative translation factor)